MKRWLTLGVVLVLFQGVERAPAAEAAAGSIHPADRYPASDLESWAKEHGTPLYVYDGDRIAANYKRIADAFHAAYPRTRIHYAVKANSNQAILAILRRAGAEAEVVSGGELELALLAGFHPDRIVFTNNSKTPREIDYALKVGAIVNVDSEDELEIVARRARALGRSARISFRLNPAVDPHTHARIATGVVDSKFGLHFTDGSAERAVARSLSLAPHVVLVGLHCHIGSQITEPEPYRIAAEEMLAFAKKLHREHGLKLEFIDFGGGLGIPYQEGQAVMSPEEWAKTLSAALLEARPDLGELPELWIEPGRSIVADAGVLLVRVASVKTTPVKTFVNVDAGFNTLARPLLYDAYHRVRIVGKSGGGRVVDIAGNVCETGDILAKARDLPETKPGDLLEFLDAGAYGFSMASEYNGRPLPAELLVRGGRVDVIRERATVEDLLRHQKVPADLH